MACNHCSVYMLQQKGFFKLSPTSCGVKEIWFILPNIKYDTENAFIVYLYAEVLNWSRPAGLD